MIRIWRSKWARLGLAAVLAAPVAVGLAPLSVSPVQAALGGTTTFEIDSNTVPNGVGATDWTNDPNVSVSNDANFTGSETVPTDVAPPSPPWLPNCTSSNSDTVFKNSTNISDPVFNQFELQSVPDKTDLCQSFFSYEVVDGGAREGNIIAYLGFTRRASNGDGSFYFLLSKGEDPNVRVDGDIGIQVDYGSQGQAQTLTVQTWEGSPVPTLGPRVNIPINDPNVELSPVELFAELAIDLTALGLAPNAYDLETPDQCLDFGYGRIISRTGNSPTATLKDDGEPTLLDFNLCGSIEIRKELTSAVPSTVAFPVTLDAPDDVTLPYPNSLLEVPGGTTNGGVAVDGNADPSPDAVPTGNPVVYSNVPPRPTGGYTVSENLTPELEASWNLVDIVCVNDSGTPDDPSDDVTTQTTSSTTPVFGVLAGEHVVCTITNEPAPVTVNVTKVVTPAGAGTDEGASWDINLTGEDSQPIEEGETISFTDIAAGNYVLSETDPANAPGEFPFDVVGWSCSINGGAADEELGASIALGLDPGDEADCTVTNELIPGPQISVTKTANPDSFQEPDGVVVYSVTVTNPGTEALTVTELTDDVSLNGGPVTTLDLSSDTPVAAAGGTVTANTCDTLVFGLSIDGGGQRSCTFTVAYSDRNAGDVIDDTVDVTGTDVFGRTVSASADATVTVTDALPVILVDKQNAQPDTIVAPGGLATYTLVVTNGPDAVEDLTITEVSDVLTVNGGAFGAVDITTVGGAVTATTCNTLIGTVLAPGESTPLCSFTIDTTDLGALAQDDVLVNTATVTGEDDEGNEATDDDPAQRTVLGEAPAIDVFKTDNGAVIQEPGEVVTYDIDIFNLGATEALTITQIVDEVAFNGNPIGSITITDGSIVSTLPDGMLVDADSCEALIGTQVAPGGSTSCTISLDLPANADDAYSDLVTVSAVDETGDEVEGDSPADTPAAGVNPVVDIVKTADPTSVLETGGEVTYTLVITNDSVESDPLTLISLSDDRFGDLFDDANPLATAGADPCNALQGVVVAPGDSVDCTITTTLVGDFGSDHTNIASVTGVDDEGDEASDADDAVVTFLNVPPTVDVTKTANPTSVPESGGDVIFTVSVQNTSDEVVTVTVLTDDVYGDLAGQGTCVLGAVLQPDATYTCSFTKFLSQQEAETSHTNTVTGTVTDDDGSTATDDDPETVDYDLIPPTVEITKTDNDATVPEPGGTVTYELTITNDSFEAVTVTSLIDTITYEDPAQVIVVNLLDEADMAAKGVTDSDCAAAVAGGLAPGEVVNCSFDLALVGNVQIVRDVVAVSVVDNDQQTDNDEDDEATPITDVPPAIGIVKTANPTLQKVGGNVTYTFVISNLSTVEDLTLLTLVDDKFGDLTAECEIAGVVLTPNNGVAGGTDETTCTIVRAVNGTSGTDHVNVATISGADDELLEELENPENEAVPVTASDDAVVRLATPGISIVKSDDVDTVLPGAQFNYILTVANTGDIETGAVTVVDDVGGIAGDPLSVVSASGTGWTCAVSPADVVTCTHASLAVGETAAPITLRVQVRADFVGTTIPNVASVSAAPPIDVPVEDEDDEATPVTPEADVAIQKSVSNANPDRGASFDWILQVANNGPNEAANLVVSDAVPAPLVVTDVTSADFSCSRIGNSVTCTRAALAVGATGTISIRVAVPVDAAAGPITNIGSVSATTPDPNLTNNSDDATATVPPVVVLPPVLPATGGDVAPFLSIAALILGVGTVVLMSSRRRRTS
jgi:uncharacterized repeat protein (TIGR01451 family)/LPXTG-motif cell wall-anchored protein